MLCLADRGFYSFERWRNARQTGAQLLWRVKSNMLLPREQRLGDGSYLTHIYRSQKAQRAKRDGEQVRVIEYQLDDGARSDPEQRYRLLCTILDPEHGPASELGGLYHERWEIENALDELKTHQRGPRTVLRSKTPDGVYQEAYGYLCTHYAIRRLMHDAALAADIDPEPIVVHKRRTRRPALSPHPAGLSPPQPSPQPTSRRPLRSSPSHSPTAVYAATHAHQAQDEQLASQAPRAPRPTQTSQTPRRRHHRARRLT